MFVYRITKDMTKHERLEAKKYLKKGDYSKIAAASKMTRVNVTAYANGTHENSTCEPFFIAMCNLRKAEAEERIQNMLIENSQPTPKSI